MFLQPGQVHVAAVPTTIVTVLASCVAICIFDPARGIGGMNHFLLPHAVGLNLAHGRFGPSATVLLIEQILAAGCRLVDLRAKVFGGANVLMNPAVQSVSIGERNARCAFDLLAERRIPIVSSDTGGTHGRKVAFMTGDGSAFVKAL